MNHWNFLDKGASMKKTRLSYEEWTCIRSKKMSGITVNTNYFYGYIGLLYIEEVDEPQIWKFNGEEIIVCNKGLKWLTILPKNDYYCITAMMDENSEIVLWYIDMIASQGIEDGVPYFDDLYLDLVVYPNGEIIEDDMDELKQALLHKDIDKNQYQLALETSYKLKRGLLSDVNRFKEFTNACYEMINNKR